MRLLLLALVCSVGLVACSTLTPAHNVAVTPTELPTPIPEVIAETAVPVQLDDSYRIETYPVSGRTAAEIRADLNRSGPLSVTDGRRFDGLTTWNLKWTLAYKQVGAGCALDWASVKLEMVVTLPELVDSPDLPAKTEASWQTYRQALESHEMGHVADQRKEAAALQSILGSYSEVWPSCRDLGTALKAEGDAKVNAIYAADKAYDDATNHGRLQGAVFP